jgi:hypothetical protein
LNGIFGINKGTAVENSAIAKTLNVRVYLGRADVLTPIGEYSLRPLLREIEELSKRKQCGT